MNGTEVDPATAQNCTRCGARLPAGALAGLCPACLLQQGVAPDTLTGPAAHAFEPPPVAELAPLFPQLEILALLGKGGMGAVYKARQKQLDRWVALKILPPAAGEDPAFAERFTREGRALAQLNHPGIVTLYEFGCVQNRLYYFLMEFVDGVNLRQLLAAGRISPREALGIVPQICDALQFAHDQGVVHRDIKPENILLDRRGRVKVADFGLAKLARGESEPDAAGLPPTGPAALTGMGQAMGTPNYMAPEQVEHPAEVDHRADIYALGVVFYQMLTGELPGRGLEPPSRKVRVDVRLDAVVLRALERKPELRYQQVSEIKTAVEALGAGSPIQAAPVEGVAESAPSELTIQPAASAASEAASQVVRPLANSLLSLGVAGLVVCCLVTTSGFVTAVTSLAMAADLDSRVQFVWSELVLYSGWLFPVLNLAVIVGALRMRALRDIGLARAGAVCAMVAPPLMPVGLLVGARALWLLGNPKLRNEFHPFTSSAVPTVSRLAVASASWAIALVAANYSLAFLDGPALPPVVRPGAGQILLQILLFQSDWPGYAASFLGAVALEDIRRGQGRLRGAWLAAFGLLVAPCRWLVFEALRTMNLVVRHGLWTTAVFLICGGLALWVWRHETRRRQSGGSDSSSHWWWVSNPGLRALQSLALIPFLLTLFNSLVLVPILRGLFK
jgi:predicted Ser/Thr protein kinase